MFFTKGMPESTTTFSVETADQVLNQTKEFVYLGGDVNHNVDLSIEVDRRIRNALPLSEVHPRTERPTEGSPQSQNSDAKSRGTRDNAEQLRRAEPVPVPLRNAAPRPPQFSDSLHRLAEESRRPPDFLSGHAYY